MQELRWSWTPWGGKKYIIHYGKETKWWSDHFLVKFRQETKANLNFSLYTITGDSVCPLLHISRKTNLILIKLYKLLNNLFKVGWSWKNTDTICYILTSLVSLEQRNLKKSKKLMKIVNIEGENLHIIWTTWEISMKFSGKIRLMILKVTKKQVSASLWKIHFWENHSGGRSTVDIGSFNIFGTSGSYFVRKWCILCETCKFLTLKPLFTKLKN